MMTGEMSLGCTGWITMLKRLLPALAMIMLTISSPHLVRAEGAICSVGGVDYAVTIAGSHRILGTPGNDVILGSSGADVIFSNGAGLGVPFIWLGHLLGARTVFFEVYDRIATPTMTARLVAPVTDLFLVQWPEQLTFDRHAVLAGPVY